MNINSDIEAMFDRAIADVFHGEFVTRDVVSDDPTWIRGVEVISRTREDRIVIIRAGRIWISGFIPQLGIGTQMVDEDDDLAYKEEELRKLCRALYSYLGGGGRVTQRHRPFAGAVPPSSRSRSTASNGALVKGRRFGLIRYNCDLGL